MSQPNYIINTIVNPPQGFPFTIIPLSDNDLQVVVVSNYGGTGSISMDRNVNLIGRTASESDTLTLKYKNINSIKSVDRNIVGYDTYIPITWEDSNILGIWSDGNYVITDRGYNGHNKRADVYLHIDKPNIIKGEVLVKRGTPAISQIFVTASGQTGSFYLDSLGNILTNTITYDDSVDIKSAIASNFISGSYSWYMDNQSIYITSPTDNPDLYNNSIININVIGGTGPNILSSGLGFDYGQSRLYLDTAIYNYENDDVIYEEDSFNNISTFYAYNSYFPFNNTGYTDNDFSQDGGSIFDNSNLMMAGCKTIGYGSINAQYAHAVLLGITVDSVILDISSCYNNQLILGDFRANIIMGPPYVIYINATFSGSINLLTGVSTLQNTFNVGATAGDYWIDADQSQYHHWTGELFIVNNYDNNTIWEIHNVQYLPDNFKITILPGTTQSFGPGNWSVPAVVDENVIPIYAVLGGYPFVIGSLGNGGEIMFIREKYGYNSVGGNYTGRILATSIILDYEIL